MDDSNARARKLITTLIDIVNQISSADNIDGILQSLKEHEVRTQKQATSMYTYHL
jgi:hypothetical protein